MRHLAQQDANENTSRLNIEASSAGLEAHGLNPHAVLTMGAHGVDISRHSSDIVNSAMLDQADVIVTVCSHADANCPLVPANKRKIHMPFLDPAKAKGTDAETAQCFSAVCQEIRDAMAQLLNELRAEAK